MQFDRFPLFRHLIVLILQEVAIFAYEKVKDVPECILFKENQGLGPELTCRNLDNSNSNVTQLLPNDTMKLHIDYSTLSTSVPLVPKMTMLTRLELPSNHLHGIRSIMLQGLSNLRNFSLEGNNITSLSEDTFLNTPNLEVIDLSNNNLISLKQIIPAFVKLKNLTVLNLSKNKRLTVIEDEDFASLENVSLGALDISMCAFKIIEKNAFKPLRFLFYLDISNNPLPTDVLTNLSQSLHKESLRTLKTANVGEMAPFPCAFIEWLNETRIESLEIENRFYCSLINLSFLKSLHIRAETIYLQDQFMKGIPNIESLTIQKHGIQSIRKQFASNIHLKFLDLSYFRKIHERGVHVKIEDFAFETLKQLSVLYLKSLPIKKIQKNMLHGLRNLEKMSFHGSEIQIIECYAFETVDNLIVADFASNAISLLSNCTFYGLKNVQDLDLSFNSITFVTGTYPFDSMIKLKYLNLRSNKIVHLQPGIFKKLYNMYMLTMSRNRIIPWTSEVLPDTLNHSALFIDKNNISHFTNEMFRDVSKLEEIDFSSNPINCSECSTVQLQDWMKNRTSSTRHTKILHLTVYGSYICYFPAATGPNPVDNVTLSPFTSHCIFVETNINLILCAVFSPILCIAVISSFVWYFWKWNVRYFLFELQLNIRKYKEHQDTKQYEFDAFVSYCDKDLQWIRNDLVIGLKNCEPGIRLCLPDRHFSPGYSITDNITWAIDHSRSTVIVLSHEYLKSNWCLYNIQMAHNMLFEKTRSGLIVIFLEEIQKDSFTKDLEYVFRTRTCIWWTENPVGQKLFWRRLHLAITRPMDKGISAHIT